MQDSRCKGSAGLVTTQVVPEGGGSLLPRPAISAAQNPWLCLSAEHRRSRQSSRQKQSSSEDQSLSKRGVQMEGGREGEREEGNVAPAPAETPFL